DALCAVFVSPDLLSVSAAQGEKRLTARFASADGIACLKGFFEDGDRLLAAHDVKRLLHLLAPAGIRPEIGFDVMLAAYLLDSSDSGTDLSRLCSAHLGRVMPEGCEAETVLALAEKLSARLESEGTASLYRETELPLAYVLFDMETAGFRVDVAGLKEYSEKLSALADEYEKNIFLMAGRTFNPNSPKQLGEVLFDEMKLPAPPGAKTKSGWSTSVDVLEKLADAHPIIETIFDYRRVKKLISTYCEGLAAAADASGDVHTTFNQTVTATGRLSSTEPNLQNIPIKTEQGRYLRRFFTARDGDMVLVDSDYSQIELRLLACIAGDGTMIDAFRTGADIHAITASQVFGVPLDMVTPELRKRAKAVNFGIVYGIGGHSLADDIGVSTKEASAYIKSYLAKYSGVDRYMKEIVQTAKDQGYVTTLAGRRRYIPELNSPKFPLRRFGERVAMNSPIQGTAADIIKKAMVMTDKALKASGTGARLILQIHDELIVECRESDAGKVAEILRSCMESAADLPVPLIVDTEIGHSWGEED
ncbi:MAG: DNA polymerase I, partial [Clostridiales bacterium]|nr:DNA polymerase I [Clostridiales bacterium]